MAEATVNQDPSVAGYVDAKRGVFGVGSTAQTITNNLNTDVNSPIIRLGCELEIYHFTSVANTNTWTTEMKGAVACAWQPEDATDDDVRAVLTYNSAQNARARVGAQFTFVTGGTRAGWLWVLKKD